MDFFSAMNLMKEGNKVRVTTWSEDKFIGIMEQDVKIFGKTRKKYTPITQDEVEISPCLPFSVLITCEWEEFKE